MIEPDNKQDCAFLNEGDEQDESFNGRFNIELDRDTKQEQRQQPECEDILFGETQKSNKKDFQTSFKTMMPTL